MQNVCYNILCACGSSIATSTVMAAKLSDMLKENDIEATIKKTTYASLESDIALTKPDLVLTSTDLKKDFGVPVVVGLAYLTNVGKNELNQKILDTLKSVK